MILSLGFLIADDVFHMVCGKELIYFITHQGGSCIQPDNLNAAYIGWCFGAQFKLNDRVTVGCNNIFVK